MGFLLNSRQPELPNWKSNHAAPTPKELSITKHVVTQQIQGSTFRVVVPLLLLAYV